ncbi:hypothetical protein M2323_004039 [Rhodoblastus acidophilus]|uniref:DUF7146 domain-containing protein n=1 Tax=Rhodoblastus acidophilus TaxID=1074 RepID=UPI0022259814|nr:toprim domain-containing protein [Rhodoblastus acidophilus]MCW2286222.1 hypothetical protein [Rhodoblastus acidophilus]MCW2335095.1 hypothetical protein [Rhodoblastus acidophilus]
MFDLRTIARALGGEVVNGQVLAPGPGHSKRDRSLAVRPSATDPDGFLVHSHCGDDWRTCRDHVRHHLGLSRDDWKYREQRPTAGRVSDLRAPPTEDDAKRTRDALAIWRASTDPRGTLAQTYLESRGLDLSDDLAGSVLRWNAHIGALVALFRNLHTGEPQAITRIFLDREGKKTGRMFKGPVGGAAVMLDDHASVAHGFFCGEGVETCMAGRQMGFKPAWALGSAGAIESLPLLAGVDAVTIFAETDDSGANARAIAATGARWRAADREVFVVTPEIGGDMNDALLMRRAG